MVAMHLANIDEPKGVARMEAPEIERMQRLLLPYDEAMAKLGGIGRTTLWELVNRGELVRVNVGRRGFITAKSLAAYVDRLSHAASAGVA